MFGATPHDIPETATTWSEKSSCIYVSTKYIRNLKDGCLTCTAYCIVPFSTRQALHHSSTFVAGITCKTDGLTYSIGTNSPLSCRTWNCEVLTENWMQQKLKYQMHIYLFLTSELFLVSNWFGRDWPGSMQTGSFWLNRPFVPQIKFLSPFISNPVLHLKLNIVPQA